MSPRPALLVADPDPRSLRILELALRKAGFAVETAVDGERALERMLDGPLGLAICDAALPSMDGLALCKAARKKDQLAGLPLLLIGADKSIKAKAIAAGADDFLAKPILLKELVQRVRLLLERSDHAQEGGPVELTGSVRDLGLVDALQSLLAAKKSAVVACEAYGRHARVWVRDGQVIDAELGALEGEPAFWRLMTWESGAFRVEPQQVDREARIPGGTEAALVEAMRRVEEMGRVSEELSMTALYSVDYAQLAERLAELPDEVNGVVRAFDGKRTLREAIDLSPVDDLSTVEVVRRLMAGGILREVESKKTALGKPSLQQWLSNPPPSSREAKPLSSLDAARAAAALAEEMAAAEEAEFERLKQAEELAATAIAVRKAGVKPLDVVHFPPLRGVRRERLRREAEEARARVGDKEPVRLSRVVELPAWQADGSDALGGARRMSPAVGEAAKTFAPDAPVSRVLGRVPVEDAEAVLQSLSAPAPEKSTEPPPPQPTPPIAPVAAATPPPALPAPAAVAPGTPPPDRQLEAEMLKALQPRKRRWGWYGIAAAASLAAAWFLRAQPPTDKKDAPWLDPSAPAPKPAPPATAPKIAEAPNVVDAPKVVEPPKVEPAPAAAQPASDELYKKALEQGDAMLRRGKYRAAIGHFQRAVREKPESVPALLALGDAYLEADKPRSAVKPLETASRLDAASGRAQLLLGTAYQSLGRNAQAVKAYGRYLELEPQGEFARDVRLILANLSH